MTHRSTHKMLSISMNMWQRDDYLISEPMSAKDSVGILIPSVFVGEITGLVIKDNYLYNQGYFVVINDDLPFNINTHLLLPFAIVVGICFLIIVIFMVSRKCNDKIPSCV